jgi:hypothetical protein
VRVKGRETFANQPAYLRLPPPGSIIHLFNSVGGLRLCCWLLVASVTDNLPHPSLHDDQINKPSLKKHH